MVKNSSVPLTVASRLVAAYLAVVVATLVVLAVLSHSDSRLATRDAWGHAVLVAVFAVLLPLRLRATAGGHRPAVRAVGLIASALLVVNVVEAALPGFVPDWMRVQMIVVAVLMAGVVADVIRWAVTTKP